jgi:D-sedoheptulose 7-phosphate isomerase
MKNYIKTYITELCEIANDTINSKLDIIVDMTKTIQKIKKNNGRLFFLGVGGSSANASHAVNDFRKIAKIECYSITDNVAELTARINDDGWDSSFSEWLKISNLNSNDGIFIFSVGGGSNNTSQNIVKAIDLAKEKNATIMSIVSRDGGYSKTNSDICYLIPSVNKDRITPHAEEYQGVIWHLIVNILKDFNDE